MKCEVKSVTAKEALEIVRTRKPIGLFYTIENGQYVGIDNKSGDAWTEGFDTCEDCIRWLAGGYIDLCTFPDDDEYRCKRFVVPMDWLLATLEEIDYLNEQKGVDLQNFLDNYCFDETYAIYEMAKRKHLIVEEEQE